VLWSFLYLAFCRLLQLLVLCVHSPERKELEILVLRHELAIARRQLARPQPSATDRGPARGLEPRAPARSLVSLLGHSKDALGLASPARRPPLDLRQPPARSPVP
jgi:hypothetical protein